MPRNPFEEENQAHEAIKGEDVINIRTERVIRIRAQDGTFQDIVFSVHDSRPDENGNFIEFKEEEHTQDEGTTIHYTYKESRPKEK